MSLYGFIAFCAAYLLAVAIPGPAVTAVIARSLSHGTRGAPALIAGFLAGDLLWFAAAAAGLSALARTAHTLFLLVRYAGAIYLLILAYRLWTAPAQSIGPGNSGPSQSMLRLFLGSLTLTLGNPKAMIFFVALLPTVVHMRGLRLPDYLSMAGAISVLLPAVLGVYVLLASRARIFFRNAHSIRLLNRGAGTVMAGAAIAVAATQ